MKLRTVAALAAMAILLTGCSTSSSTQTPTASATTGASATPTVSETATPPTVTGGVTIYAAASLRAAFDEIAAEFAAENPGVTVNPIVYDGSSTLVTQLLEGAQADVLATAAEKNMADAAELAPNPQLFATNTLVVATPADNPGNVTTLADLATAVTVLCAPDVPCGAASEKLLAAQGVTVTPASLEQNVTAVLVKVAEGEADAGLVYATDVIGEQDVASFVPDGAADVINKYPIAVLEGASDAGKAFVEFVLSDTGQAILASYGFGSPRN